MAEYTYGELYYVKLRRIVPGESDRKWLGWLGLGSEEGYSTFIGSENEVPSKDTKILAVQWVFERNPTPTTPRYLRALNYPDGQRYLGGRRHNGFYCYWDPGDDNGNPVVPDVDGASYALALTPVPGSNEFIVSRAGDNGTIYTYNDYYMGYWKDGNDFEITWEFIPAATFSTKNENWMRDKNAIIGAKSLADIAIPGSHDAGSVQITRPLGNVTSQTQGLSIYDQLLAGSRYLDLRTKKYDGIWWINHGGDWSTLKLGDVVHQLTTFLQAHPEEKVIVTLLVDENPGVFGPQEKEAWELVFDELHPYHLNCLESPNGPERSISQVTPNNLNYLGKNLLLFAWGAAQSWTYGPNNLFISPWSSGLNTAMDREGVYVDSSFATVMDIYGAYNNYTRPSGSWILHTNSPFGASLWTLYEMHWNNTPGLTQLFQNAGSPKIDLPKVNIVNIDYVGDVVKGYNLVDAVIERNK